MATTLSVKIKGEFNIISYGKADDLSTPTESLNLSESTTYSFGLGDNKAEVIYRARLTVTGTTTLDLYGTLTDIFGDTVNIEILRAIYVHNRSTTSGDNIRVGPAGSNAMITPFVDANGRVSVGPGGTFVLDCPKDGYAAAVNADTLQIVYSGVSGSIDVDVALLGNSGDFVSSSSSSSSSPASVSSSSSSSSTVQASWSSSSTSKSVSSSSSVSASSQSSSSTSSSTVQQSGSSSSSTSSSST